MNQHDRLGPYRLLRRLGEGGMGVVHLALDSQGRQVAVKVLRGEVAGDDVARRRLSREVETMRRVRSRYIAEVVDADVTGSRPYIVTRYVPGMPLDDTVKQKGPLRVEGLLRVARGVAEALAAVHATGVIHRDLKPGNVLLLDGEPVLIDFGIAQAVDATRLTQTGMFIGTPGYLAPEIIEGHEAGPEVDVHAWAGTMLFAATGLPPFGKGTLEMVFYNITAGRANVDAAPPVLRPLLRAAFSRDPAKRPSAAELAARLALIAPPSRTAQGRPVRPDEALTVPDVSGVPEVADVPGTGTPPPRPAAPAASEEFVSLLGDAPPKAGGEEPWPTVRVTGDELRAAGGRERVPPSDLTPAAGRPEADIPTRHTPPASPESPAASPAEGEIPTRYAPPSSSQPWKAAEPAPLDQGEVPTRRVRPEELAGVERDAKLYRATPARPEPGTATPPPPMPPVAHGLDPSPAAPPVRPHNQALFEQAPEIFEKTPHVRHPAAPPYVPTVHLPPEATPGYSPPVARELPEGSPVYGVAGALVLVVAVGAALLAPVLTAALVLPAVVLLRAADLAGPGMGAPRASDVLRVAGRPGAMLKSLAVTVGLLPYALILGVPVALVLTFLVDRVPTSTALSWGVAVSLWIVCAGPGVEGPGRQMRRTLAAALPSKGMAFTFVASIGLVAALAVLYAVSTLVGPAGDAVWSPLDVSYWIEQLEGLRRKAG
ncbi:serine/threonine-protein kinase [Sphaerisporangium sp. TRM90804]|uniref:serine/threonine-protein kinase n=1 Tax=Sphaerisporangium sp. TRM90804 TaxID=3031113 RepID=UPI00244B5DC7|nr:serine/threonine-protein kinase [Sphaerisporangium sp. TRM90804]MDH2427661.1 protein kinase [Sphaerisporangium sp. TRM90804]